MRSGEEADFLAPLPLEVLPVDPAVTARLAAFGLDCLGAVAGLGPADLQRQFGPDGIRLHRLARGEDSAGILPAPAQRTWSERLVLDGATGDLEILLRGARECAMTLGGRLTAEALAAGEVSVAFELEEMELISTSGVPPSPAGNAGELWTAALGLLGLLQPQAPVAAVRVSVTRLTPAAGRQADLLGPATARERRWSPRRSVSDRGSALPRCAGPGSRSIPATSRSGASPGRCPSWRDPMTELLEGVSRCAPMRRDGRSRSGPDTGGDG